MEEIIGIISRSYKSYASSVWETVTHPFGDYNYFTLLIIVSLAVWGLELAFPWRKKQRAIRKDFWIDAFYMFFNFYIFNLIIFIALSNTTAHLFGSFMGAIGLPEKNVFDFSGWNPWVQFIAFFLIADFVQWSVHNMLHRIPWMWRFHKVHHSVTEMGFAAHLRYHFMENVFYKTALYIFLGYLFNFKLEYAFFLHAGTIIIGHINHANVGWDYGPLKYILNNPKMHIWHHAKDLPESHPHGMNFGISLSLWDYIFKTNYIPSSGRDIPLGFEKIEEYPSNFIEQQIEAFKPEK
ncbi:MAG: sterol desaturase family protein [Crocinitomicaceae bacterium]